MLPYPIGTSGTPNHRVGVSRHSSFLVTSPPKMVEFSTGLDRQGDNNALNTLKSNSAVQHQENYCYSKLEHLI